MQMINRTIAQIKDMIPVKDDISSFKDVSINGVSIDSRKIEPGNLFIPLKGEHSDGHQFVEGAIQKGAAAALWQKDVPNPPANLPILVVEDTLLALQELARSYRNQLNVKVVGITGSNGKTTVKDMTTNLLSLKYKVQKTKGNYNNHIGLPLTVLSLDENTEIAVLEMGMSSKGEIDFLSRLARPNVVIVTNIGESHLQDLGSREGIAEAKLEILNGLQENGLIVYLGDEPLLKERLQDFKGNVKIQTFGKDNHNDLYPMEIKTDRTGSLFTVNQWEGQIELPVLGTHNIINALSAMLTARYFDIPFSEMNTGFANLKLTNMRMELLEGKKGETIINDAYNASPTSMKAAVELTSSLPGFHKKILVLGDMLELGNKEMEFHYEIGTLLDPNKIDYLFAFGTLGQSIADGAKKVLPLERVLSFKDKESLIDRLKMETEEHTLVLVKASRGMKLEEVVEALQK
jgi:UDP-N-acetylmuramoyl-tripeptide--D-alanyl-D-alanine ligase